MKIFAIAVLLIVVIAIVIVARRKKDVSTDLQESSMNFDMKNLRPFLVRLSHIVQAGFSESEIETVISLAMKLKVDQQNDFTFDIKYNDKSTKLKISILLDDIDAPDVYFYSCPELANAINNEMVKFAEELGI
jgi:hypothetical protein